MSLAALSSPNLPDEMPDNRRSGDREAADSSWLTTVLAPDGESELTGRVLDTSSSGAQLALYPAADGFDTGEELVVTVHSPSRQFTRRARLRWRRDEGGELKLGVAFIDHVALHPETHRLDIAVVRVDPACALKLPAQLALRRRLLPFGHVDGWVNVACADREDAQGLQIVERLFGLPSRAWEVDAAALEQVLRKVYGDGAEALSLLAAPGRADPANAVAQTEELLHAACLRQASDIHIDPTPEEVHIRIRVDGCLETLARLPLGVHQELVGRLKVLSGMDISEKRAPQDGRFTHAFGHANLRLDVRAATLPTKYGERMTLRLLAMQTGSLTLDRLGLSPAHRLELETFLRRSQGMLILTGPTGSGKTTTLYAAIRMLLQERNANILTVEDPIEYEIPGVAQCEVDSADKVSFAKALRSILRHDPDVVMIGEIRDRETADVAIKAALTGHLVLGTLHTNSAAASVTRLLDMGVESYLVAATLRLAVSQRLVRRLCPHCRLPRAVTRREALGLGRSELAGVTVFEPCGCLYCSGRGFSGRIGLYEQLSLRAEWTRLIAEGQGETALLEKMREAGVPFLLDDAITKLREGLTSLGEIGSVALSW